MKRIFLVLSIILLLGIVYIALMNTSNPANINLLYNNMLDTQTKVDLSTQGAYLYKSINLSVYTIIVLLSGMFVGAGIVYMFLSATNEKVKAYQRELEKTSISGLNNASRVEVLEAKIKTLEKAFNTVADERTQLEVQIKNLNAEIDNLNKE